MTRVLKVILYFLVFVLIIGFALGVAGIILEDKLVSLSLDQFSKQVNVTVRVHSVKFSLIKDFPYASVSMKGVHIKEGSLDTPPEFETGLLSVEEITLKFGLIGILKKEYDIKELIIKNGWLNLYFDQKGQGNFEVFSKSDSKHGNWLLELNQFKIDQVTLSYIDPKTGWSFKGFIDNATLKGNFFAHGFLLDVKSKLKVGNLRQGSFYYIMNQNVNFASTLVVTDNSIDFETENIRIEKTLIKAKGTYGRGVGSPILIGVNGTNLDINSLVSLLSQYNITLPQETKTKGQIEFNLSINGLNKVDKPFELEMGFKSKHLDLILPEKTPLTIKNLNGKFFNGSQGKPESSEIHIADISVFSGESTLTGTIKIKNIVSPLYHIKVSHALSIRDLMNWGINLNPLENGNLYGDFEALGMLNSIENLTISDFNRIKLNANVVFDNLSFTSDLGVNLDNVKGNLRLFNQDITKSSAEGFINGSRFNVDLKAQNATALVFGNGKTTINTSITIDSLNTILFSGNDQLHSKSSQEISIMDRINTISGDVFVDNLVYSDFICQPLSASFYLTKDQLSSNSFMVRSCGGIFTGKFNVNGVFDEEGSISADINIDGVDITQLFNSFANFGQETVKASNISGILDGTVLFASPLMKNRFVNEGMIANSYLKISSGSLNGVKEMEGLSRFISLEELKDIQFQTLENNIIVENQEVIIPRMDIKSSAIDLSLSGKHAFKGNYIYRIDVLLSDVLLKKALKNNPENNQFGEVEDDGSGRTKLFLKIEGDNDDFKVSYDGATARNAFKESIRKERNNLRYILREEFSFMHRKEMELESENELDSITLDNHWEDVIKDKQDKHTSKEKKETSRFKIEWDDD